MHYVHNAYCESSPFFHLLIYLPTYEFEVVDKRYEINFNEKETL
jgi:hypothetical protein